MEMHQTLAPFILATETARAQETRNRGTGGRKFSWMMYWLRDGRATWQDPEGNEHVLHGDNILITWRSRPGPLRVPAQAEFLNIIFDVVPRPREPHPVIGWRPLVGTTQPGPMKIIGIRPPYVIEVPHLVRSAQQLLERVCVRWWRSEQDQVVCNMMLAGWIGQLIEHYTQAPEQDPIARAEQYARRALASGCTVADMAREVGMKRSVFSERYTIERQESPGVFLRRVRLELAIELLTQTTQSVTEIAEASGFRNRSSFSRSFRQQHGCSPQAYRQRQ